MSFVISSIQLKVTIHSKKQKWLIIKKLSILVRRPKEDLNIGITTWQLKITMINMFWKDGKMDEKDKELQ